MRQLGSPLAVLAVCASAMCLGGCARYEVAGVFTQPVLANYERHAMVGLPQDREQILMAEYINAFGGRPKRFIERRRLEELLQEQGIAPGRLEQEMGAGYDKSLGVEAVIFAHYEEDVADNSHTQKMTIRIVDAQTGDLTGSVVLTAVSQSGVSARRLSRRVVKELVADLRKRLRPAPPRAPAQTSPPPITPYRSTTTLHESQAPPRQEKLPASEVSRRLGAKPY